MLGKVSVVKREKKTLNVGFDPGSGKLGNLAIFNSGKIKYVRQGKVEKRQEGGK